MSRYKTKNPNNLYKKRYRIVFYGPDDDTYIVGFDNAVEICKYKELPVTESNVTVIRVEIYRAIKNRNHQTRMLNGQPMYVYLIDVLE